MNSLQLAEAGIQHAAPGCGPDYSAQLRAPLLMEIKTMLRQMALDVAGGPDAHLLRKDFTVALAAGVADLNTAAAIQAPDPLLLEFVSEATITHPSYTSPLIYVSSLARLRLGSWPAAFCHFAVEGLKLYTLAGEDEQEPADRLAALTGNLAISGNCIPLLSSVPKTKEGEMIERAQAAAVVLVKQMKYVENPTPTRKGS
jgi:hypothetical protein